MNDVDVFLEVVEFLRCSILYKFDVESKLQGRDFSYILLGLIFISIDAGLTKFFKD